MDGLHNLLRSTMAIDRHITQCIVAAIGHRWTQQCTIYRGGQRPSIDNIASLLPHVQCAHFTLLIKTIQSTSPFDCVPGLSLFAVVVYYIFLVASLLCDSNFFYTYDCLTPQQ